MTYVCTPQTYYTDLNYEFDVGILSNYDFFPIYFPNPRVNLADVGSNNVSDVKQRIILVDLGKWVGYNHQMALVENNHQMALAVLWRPSFFINKQGLFSVCSF